VGATLARCLLVAMGTQSLIDPHTRAFISEANFMQIVYLTNCIYVLDEHIDRYKVMMMIMMMMRMMINLSLAGHMSSIRSIQWK